jgi:hypothetical protein
MNLSTNRFSTNRGTKPIKYQVYNMPNLSQEIQDALNKQNYLHLILEPDHWQHFLVPR